MKNEKLTFTCGEGGEAEEFFVVEQTRLNGVTYLLVADSEEDDAECLILKDTSTPEEKDSVYEMVEEEVELNAVLRCSKSFWRMWRLKCRRNCQKNISDR